MPKLEQRINRLERATPQTEATTASAVRVWKWCVSEGWPVPKARPDEAFAEWLAFVPDETLALMVGRPLTRHPMSRPSRADEARRRRIEERINEERINEEA